MRVLWTSSRDWDDTRRVDQCLQYLYNLAVSPDPMREMVVVHGDARGGDTLAERWVQWAAKAGARVRTERHQIPQSDWTRLGKAAGPARNRKMVDRGADICVALCRNQSAGTTGCARMANEAGIWVWFHNYGDPPPPSPTRFDLGLK